MKNTGAGDLRPVHGSWRGDLRNVQIFSAARLSDILPGSYLVSEQSPGSSQCCGQVFPFPHSLYIIKENSPAVKRNFSVFHENMQIFLAGRKCWKIRRFSTDFATFSPQRRNRRHIQLRAGHDFSGQKKGGESPLSPPQFTISTQRPSKYPWYTSCRTQGIRPQCRSGPEAYSGR